VYRFHRISVLPTKTRSWREGKHAEVGIAVETAAVAVVITSVVRSPAFGAALGVEFVDGTGRGYMLIWPSEMSRKTPHTAYARWLRQSFLAGDIAGASLVLVAEHPWPARATRKTLTGTSADIFLTAAHCSLVDRDARSALRTNQPVYASRRSSRTVQLPNRLGLLRRWA